MTIAINGKIKTERHFDPRDYGAALNGTTNDTAAWQACITACAVKGGGIIDFPAGISLISPNVLTIPATASVGYPTAHTGAHVSIIGEGRGVCLFSIVGNTGIGITSYAYGGLMSGFAMSYAGGVPTSGACLYFPGNAYTQVQDLLFYYCFDVFRFGTTGSSTNFMAKDIIVRNCYGAAFDSFGNMGQIVIDNVMLFGDVTKSTSIVWRYNTTYIDVLVINNLDAENFYGGMRLIGSGAGAGLADSFFNQIIIDATVTESLVVVAVDSAVMSRNKFSQLWLTSSTLSALALGAYAGIDASHLSIFEDNTFEHCNFSGLNGVIIEGNGTNSSRVRNTTFDHCQIYGWTNFGIYNVASDDMSFLNGTIGVSYDTGGLYGLYLAGGANSLRTFVADTVFRNCATATIFDAGIGAGSQFRSNPGYNPVGALTAPGVPATTVALATPFFVDCTVYVMAGAATALTITVAGVSGTYSSNITVATAGTVAVEVPVGASIKMTYATATPTWTWVGK